MVILKYIETATDIYLLLDTRSVDTLGTNKLSPRLVCKGSYYLHLLLCFSNEKLV